MTPPEPDVTSKLNAPIQVGPRLIRGGDGGVRRQVHRIRRLPFLETAALDKGRLVAAANRRPKGLE